VPNTIEASVRCCFSFSASLGSPSQEKRSNDPYGKCRRDDLDDPKIHDTTRLTLVARKRSQSTYCVTDTDVKSTMKIVSTLNPTNYSHRNSTRSSFKCQGSKPLQIS
jgi:hypothetical protein